MRKVWLGNAADFKMGHYHLEMVSEVRDGVMAHDLSAMVSVAMARKEV